MDPSFGFAGDAGNAGQVEDAGEQYFGPAVPPGGAFDANSMDNMLNGLNWEDSLHPFQDDTLNHNNMSAAAVAEFDLAHGMLDDDDEEPVEEKAMAEFARQGFKRPKRPGTAKDGKRKRGLASCTGEDDEDQEEIDEADQAETDEFFSQLIQPTTEDDGEMADENESRGLPGGKKRPRWHPQESEFFRKCAALFDCNYTMIHDFLPHRSVGDLKKQYDKQRTLYSSLYASFGTTPRFHTVTEYHQLKAQLQEDKVKLDESMVNLGIKPWATRPPVKKKKGDLQDESQDGNEDEEKVESDEEGTGVAAADADVQEE